MNTNTVRRLLAEQVQKEGSLRAWSAKYGAAEASFLWRVINGQREPSEPILDALGLERVVSYRKKR